MSPPQYVDLGPLPNPTLPLHTKVFYYLCGITIHYLARALLVFKRYKAPRSQRPTLLKTYPANPHLEHRVFYPPNYRPGYDHLPLFLDIHGGGFTFADPSFDDQVNAPLAANSNCIVISLDYSKAPMSTFPTPTRELISTVNSILGDISLSFDRNRVVIGGYSAGGNLALSVAQSKSLRGKIHGIAAWYAVCDFSNKTEYKLTTRPYDKQGDGDMLANMGPIFNACYIPADQDLRDPVLSPKFAKRQDLPEWLCWVGAEYDMLCMESGVMAARMTGRIGIQADGTDSEGERWWRESNDKNGFEDNSGKEKWIMAKNALHGFSHHVDEKGEKEERRRVQASVAYREVGEWLARGPFAEKSKK